MEVVGILSDLGGDTLITDHRCIIHPANRDGHRDGFRTRGSKGKGFSFFLTFLQGLRSVIQRVSPSTPDALATKVIAP